MLSVLAMAYFLIPSAPILLEAWIGPENGVVGSVAGEAISFCIVAVSSGLAAVPDSGSQPADGWMSVGGRVTFQRLLIAAYPVILGKASD